MSVQEALFAKTYAGSLAFHVTEASAEGARGEMPVSEGCLNPFGTVHAGAMIWFADVIATVCAVGSPDQVGAQGQGFPLAIDMHTVLTGNTRAGVLVAQARPVKRGRKLIVMRTEVSHEGTLLMTMTSSHLRA